MKEPLALLVGNPFTLNIGRIVQNGSGNVEQEQEGKKARGIRAGKGGSRVKFRSAAE